VGDGVLGWCIVGRDDCSSADCKAKMPATTTPSLTPPSPRWSQQPRVKAHPGPKVGQHPLLLLLDVVLELLLRCLAMIGRGRGGRKGSKSGQRGFDSEYQNAKQQDHCRCSSNQQQHHHNHRHRRPNTAGIRTNMHTHYTHVDQLLQPRAEGGIINRHLV